MHTLYPKIEEDNEIQKVLSAKQPRNSRKADQLRDLVVLAQFYLDSNLDKVCSQVVYKSGPTIWGT
jgi:hypothetical protein